MLHQIGFVLLLAGQAYSSGDWSYEGDNGPDNWDHVSPKCGGDQQSPINIKDTKFRADLGQFKFVNYNITPSANQLDLLNNGHAIQVSVPESMEITVSDGDLGGTYQLVQFHMHWGSTDCRGSEHTVNGYQYPLEIHYVHYNKKYQNIGEALNHPDGLAVLGVFVDVHDQSHPAFEKITNQLSQVKYSGSSAKIAEPFSLNSFLPTNVKDFIRYSGSLTTPNCNEVVTWTIFNSPVLISHTQMNAMRAVSFDTSGDEKDKPMVNNYRPVQDLKSRTVYASFNFQTTRPSLYTTCGATAVIYEPGRLAILSVGLVAGITVLFASK